jgi:GDPmannose 4,6-dehydratase
MWQMLQQDEPEDFVIATNETHTVREFVDRAFARVGLDPAGYVGTDPAHFRPAEVDQLRGDFTKAKEKLGWEPQTSFEELVDLMVDSDLQRLETAGPVARFES